ncbi:thiosulfate transporter TsuA-like isoform X2 [Crassostrea virginica]
MTSSLLHKTRSNQVSYIDVETTKDSFSDGTCSESGEPPGEEGGCQNCGKLVLTMGGVGLCGAVFGIAMEKSRVFEPKAIRDQMVFENFIMLKMFLSAVATGQACLALLSLIPATKDKFDKASQEFMACFNNRGILSSLLGAFMLGVGMTLSGACPGMVLPQVGAWVPNSPFTLIGALVGALTYGLLASHIDSVMKPTICFQHKQVHEKLNVRYAVIAVPMAVLISVGVFVLEWFWSYRKDLESLGRLQELEANIVTTIAWPPYVGGALIGLLQAPIVLLVSDTIGGSSGYVTVVSQLFYNKSLQRMFPYLASRRSGVGNWWQVVYVVFAIGGGAISAASSNSFGLAKGVPVYMALLGGVVMLWGARLAAGCTSGHGLSGMGLLTWLSFIAVPSMFAGAIVTAFSMQATGALDTYVTAMGDVG